VAEQRSDPRSSWPPDADSVGPDRHVMRIAANA
jgi:hypothetical protein